MPEKIKVFCGAGYSAWFAIILTLFLRDYTYLWFEAGRKYELKAYI
ncbi:MAG TPA: hypothetical protein VFY41_02515 [Nitrososphaeraceae archaeon]|nr:hypothetical protein [Nitrososphaeraceae archaeon]